MTEENAYIPDFPVPPGETLAEYMDLTFTRKRDMARSLGLPVQDVVALITGDMPVTEPLAQALETVTGIKASFWLRLEANYRDVLARHPRPQDPQSA